MANLCYQSTRHFELSVSFQMQPRPLQQYTPQYYSNVGTSSTAYTAPAPAPPQYTQMPPAPFAASFISTQHAQGGDKEHESTSTQDLPPPPVNSEKALKNATGVPPVLTDIRNDAGGQSKSESSSRQLSEETKPERTPAFSSTPSQTVNLQMNSSLLGTAPPGVLSTAGKSGGLIGSGSGSLFSQGVNPPPPPANNGKINNDTALAHVSSGSSSSPTSVTSSTSALFSSLSSTASTNTKDAKPERTPAFRSTSSRTVDPQTDSSLFGATPPGVLANAGKVGSLIGSGSGSLFNQRAYPPPATKGNLWTMASVNNSTAPVQVLSESSSPSFITSTKPTPSLASLSSSASVGVAGHSPSLVFSSDPWPAPRPLGRGQIGPGFPTQSRHSTSTRVVPEFPLFLQIVCNTVRPNYLSIHNRPINPVIQRFLRFQAAI